MYLALNQVSKVRVLAEVLIGDGCWHPALALTQSDVGSIPTLQATMREREFTIRETIEGRLKARREVLVLTIRVRILALKLPTKDQHDSGVHP